MLRSCTRRRKTKDHEGVLCIRMSCHSGSRTDTGMLSSKAEFRDGVRAMGEIKDLESKAFTDRQLDELFDHMDRKSEHALRLEDFIRTFDPDKLQKTKRRDGGKGEHKDGLGKSIRSHSFTEVIMECKDGARGTEQNIVVKVNTKVHYV